MLSLLFQFFLHFIFVGSINTIRFKLAFVTSIFLFVKITDYYVHKRAQSFFLFVESLLKLSFLHVLSYIRQKCYEDADPLQCIVISLKDQFYEKAGALVGIYKDRKTESSGVLHVDLTRFDGS